MGDVLAVLAAGGLGGIAAYSDSGFVVGICVGLAYAIGRIHG